MSTSNSKHRYAELGFTIVELLIVIVVIAILAAITLVAYNGIQQQARSSSLQSIANQTGNAVLAYAPQNADLYPQATTYTTDLNLPAATAQATYDYYVSDDRKFFCISITDTTTSPETAYAFTQNGRVVSGRCVKNLVANPSFETGISWWYANGANTIAQSTDTVYVGGFSQKVTPSSSATYTGTGLGALGTTGLQYTFSAYVNSSSSQSINFAADTYGVNTTRSIGSTWNYFSVTGTKTGTSSMYVRATAATGIPFYVDGVMVIQTANKYQYNDPSTNSNWSWTNTPNNSPSFGPASTM